MRRLLLILIGIILIPLSAGAIFFTDLSPDHKNFVSITYLSENGVLNGFSDGTFKPDRAVNRAEALKILVLGSFLEVENLRDEKPFPDVEKDAWYALYVNVGKDMGVIQGTKDGLFEPSRTINRAEALKMAIAINGIELDNPSKNPFLDVDKDAWFAKYFAFAKENNFFENPSYAAPAQEITRGELSEIFYRIEKWKENSHESTGRASFYADFFEGRKTSNGEIFSQDKYTGAHQAFDFGTKVLVENLENGKSVVVQINDRGPYAEGNIIDLTTTAFGEIAPLSSGVVQVRLSEVPEDVPLGVPDKSACNVPSKNQQINKDFYDYITLDDNLPMTYRKNEVFFLEGTTDSENEKMTVLLGDEHFRGDILNGRFSIPVFFSKNGEFTLGMVHGLSGETLVKSIEVFEPDCEINFDEQSGSAPENILIDNQNGDAVFSWEDEWNNFFKVVFTQGEKKAVFYVNGSHSFTPPAEIFKNFNEGLVNVEISGAPLENRSSISQEKAFKLGENITFYAVNRYEYEASEDVKNLSLPSYFILGNSFKISGEIAQPLRENATLIAPDGTIFDVPLKIDGNKFSLSYTPEVMGTFIVEINADTGMAIVNVPISQKGFVPFLPYFREIANIELQEDVDLTRDRKTLLALVNNARQNSGLSSVDTEEKLNALAQFRADDMRDREYFSHTDPDGKKANDYLSDHSVKVYVSENIGLDANLVLSHNGLMYSPIHRRNILDKKWTKVGLGVSKRKSGEIIVVELFAEDEYDVNNIESQREEILSKINAQRKNLLLPNVTLSTLAQDWTQKVSEDDFFDFVDTEGNHIQDNITEAGITTASSVLMFKISSFSDFMQALDKDETEEIIGAEQKDILLDENWEDLGVGITVNEVGQIFIVLIVSG